MADINNSLGQSISSTTDQDNKDIALTIITTDGELTTIVNAINNNPTFAITPIQSLYFIIEYFKEEDPLELISVTYKLLNKGKGTYGIGGTPIAIEDLLFIESTDSSGGGVILNQDNKPRLKPLGILESTNKNLIAARINTLPLYTVSDTDVMEYTFLTVQTNGDVYAYDINLIGLGKGNYGSLSGTTVTAANIHFTQRYEPTTSLLTSLEGAQVISLGNILPSDISDFVNAMTAVLLQNGVVYEGDIIFQTNDAGDYLFLGAGGLTGFGAQQTTDADFYLLPTGDVVFSGINSVTGELVDNTDVLNPIVLTPNLQQVGDIGRTWVSADGLSRVYLAEDIEGVKFFDVTIADGDGKTSTLAINSEYGSMYSADILTGSEAIFTLGSGNWNLFKSNSPFTTNFFPEDPTVSSIIKLPAPLIGEPSVGEPFRLAISATVNGGTPIYADVNGNLPLVVSGGGDTTSIYHQAFEYTTGAKLFDLDFEATNVHTVFINGVGQNKSTGAPIQYRINTGTTLEILDELNPGDYVWIAYSHSINDTATYSKTEVDALLSAIVITPTPIDNKLILGDTTPLSPAHTGTTMTTVVRTYNIPANKFKEGKVYRFAFRSSMTGTGQLSCNIKFDAEIPTPPKYILNITQGNVPSQTYTRFFSIQGGNLTAFVTSGAYHTDVMNMLGIPNLETYAFDVTLPHTVTVSFGLGAASNVSNIVFLIIEEI